MSESIEQQPELLIEDQVVITRPGKDRPHQTLISKVRIGYQTVYLPDDLQAGEFAQDMRARLIAKQMASAEADKRYPGIETVREQQAEFEKTFVLEKEKLSAGS